MNWLCALKLELTYHKSNVWHSCIWFLKPASLFLFLPKYYFWPFLVCLLLPFFLIVLLIIKILNTFMFDNNKNVGETIWCDILKCLLVFTWFWILDPHLGKWFTAKTTTTTTITKTANLWKKLKENQHIRLCYFI